MAKILGRLVGLSRGRVVFLAPHPTKPHLYYVGFINEDGDETKLIMSGEALDALVAMRTDPLVGTPERAFPSKPKPPVWRLVECETAKPSV